MREHHASTLVRLKGIGLLNAQWRILVALMLRDIKTRFFGSEWGFLLSIGWPLSHILILLGIYTVMGRAAPYGGSIALWSATGIVPFMCFSYMSRFIQLGAITNKQLLAYPVLKFTDIMFARALVEVLSAGVVILTLAGIFWVYDIDFMPLDPIEACYALLASALLGLGMGVINAPLTGLAPMWATGYALVTILLWMTSGVVFVPDALPEQVRDILSYNPVLQCVEWMRASYFEGYGQSILDKTYTLSWGCGSLFIGLAVERLLRGTLLIGNG